MGVKEWAHSFFFLMSESWAKLKKLMSVEHVGKLTFEIEKGLAIAGKMASSQIVFPRVGSSDNCSL